MDYPLIAGRYRLLDKLGRGAWGTVHLAQDEKLAKKVAIKLTKDGTTASIETKSRLEREVAACARVKHPNVIHLLDFGEDEHYGLFYTMEFLAGRSLGQILDNRGSLTEKETLELLADLAHGLKAIHDAQLVHRDLSCGNVLLTDEGAVICDFGLVLDEYATQLTKTGSVVGTPAYISPEVLLGEEASAQSDIYQLGIIGYEVLIGKPPFVGKNIDEVFAKILAGKYERPSAIRNDISSQWDEWISHVLALKPDKRPQRADELIDELPSRLAHNSAPNEDLCTQKESRFSKLKTLCSLLAIVTLTILFFWARREEQKVGIQTSPSAVFSLLAAKRKGVDILLECPANLPEDLRFSTVINGKTVKLPHKRDKEAKNQLLVIPNVPKDQELKIHFADETFTLGSVLKKMAIDFTSRLIRHRPMKLFLADGEQPVINVNRVLQGFFSDNPVEKAKLRARENAIRSEQTAKRIKNNVSKRFLDIYEKAAACATLVQQWPTVPYTAKQKFLTAMDIGRKIEIMARVENVPFRLPSRDQKYLRESRTYSEKSFANKLSIYSQSTFLCIGQMGFQKGFPVKKSFSTDFKIDSLRTADVVELRFLTRIFKRLTLAIYVNDLFAGRLYCQPWLVPKREHGESIDLFLVLPRYLFNEGHNRLLIAAETISPFSVGDPMKLYEIEAQW